MRKQVKARINKLKMFDRQINRIKQKGPSSRSDLSFYK